jgi:hypothetical protein
MKKKKKKGLTKLASPFHDPKVINIINYRPFGRSYFSNVVSVFHTKATGAFRLLKLNFKKASLEKKASKFCKGKNFCVPLRNRPRLFNIGSNIRG